MTRTAPMRPLPPVFFDDRRLAHARGEVFPKHADHRFIGGSGGIGRDDADRAVTVVLNSALSKAIKYRFKTIIYYCAVIVDAPTDCWRGAARRQSVIAVVKDFPGVRAAAGTPQMRDRNIAGSHGVGSSERYAVPGPPGSSGCACHACPVKVLVETVLIDGVNRGPRSGPLMPWRQHVIGELG